MDLNFLLQDPVVKANWSSGPTPEWAQFSPLYYLVEHVLSLFYLVHPYRTMHKTIDDVPNFYNMTIRMAPFVMVLELILMKVRKLPTYRTNDLLAGVCALTLAALPQIWLEDRIFKWFAYLYDNYRIIDLPYDSMWTWLLCVLLVDLFDYFIHALSHYVHWFWASHVVHHSADHHNLLAGARNGIMDKMHLQLLMLPLSIILPTGCLKAHHQLNYTYQLLVHTVTVPSLGWLEYIFATPISHLYHHGTNRFCIDKNFGGFLNIWDILFGTMIYPWDHPHDKVEIYTGIVEPVRSWDMVYVYSHVYRNIIVRAWNFENWGDKFGAIFKGPGWSPGTPWCGYIEDIPEVPPDDKKKKYNKPSDWDAIIYCGVQASLTYLLSLIAVGYHRIMPTHHLLLAYLFSFWGVANVGYILEHKWYAPHLEWTRCAAFFVVEWILSDYLAMFGNAVTFAKLWFAFSIAILPFYFQRFISELKAKPE